MALCRLSCAALTLLMALGCQRLGLVKEYEYDERVDVSLDGSAIVDVNASIPALVALRGLALSVDPEARFDRQAIRRLYEAPGATVREVSAFRRHGRRFVHVQIDARDLSQLSTLAPLAWSRYALERIDQEFRFVQEVGPPARREVGDVGWTGGELVAFRVHLPSRVNFHNSPDDIERGNILVWEQSLQARAAGTPLVMEARMATQSILSRTLLLFGGSFAAAVALLMIVVWWIARKGRRVVTA